jgi:phosphoglycerate dehydrogenase-like enzyme
MSGRSQHRVVVYGDAFADRIPELKQRLGGDYAIKQVPYGTSPREMESAFARAIAVVAVRTDVSLPLDPALRLLQVPGIGWDEVDPRHVPIAAHISNVGGHETAVAEYCVAQMLEWRHRLRDADASFRRGSWERSSRFGGSPHRELRGATVGIIGFGGVGRMLTRFLAAFEVRVLAANRSAIADHAQLAASYPLDRLPDMMSECDFAVAAIALTPETQGLVGRVELDALGPEGVLINVARGPVVEEYALWEALTNNRLGGAILDVWYRYPETIGASDLAPAHCDFASLPNVLMTPHISGWTEGTAARRVAAIAENIRRAAAGKALLNVVAPGMRS